jgi:hypothetical protein
VVRDRRTPYFQQQKVDSLEGSPRALWILKSINQGCPPLQLAHHTAATCPRPISLFSNL